MTRYVENLFWKLCALYLFRQSTKNWLVWPCWVLSRKLCTPSIFFLFCFETPAEAHWTCEKYILHMLQYAVRYILYGIWDEVRFFFLALASNVTVTAARFSPVMHQRSEGLFLFFVIVTSPENVFIARWTTNLSVVLEWKNLFFFCPSIFTFTFPGGPAGLPIENKRSLDFPLRTTEQSNFWERDSMDNSAIERSLLMTYKVVSQDCCSVIH